jgi:phosphate transport system substrate-binding protein
MSRLVRVFGVVVIAALVATACGSSKKSTTKTPSGATTTAMGASDTATLAGAGSTFVKTIMDEWIKDYGTVAPHVTITYQGVGSGAGIQQLTAKTVDFAGSDVPLKPAEQAATGGAGAVVEVPWIAGGIAIEYNLPGVSGLKLSPDTIAGIFVGKIKKWNDPAIKADNAGVSLPAAGIQVVHRSDGSGTTNVFSAFLNAAAPSIWTFAPAKDWPAGAAGTGQKGSDGVTAAVKQTQGAIGYSEVSYAKQSGLGIALVKNKGGQFVGPTADGVSAAMAAATLQPDLTLKINYTPDDPKAYPISTTTYLLFYKTLADAAKATALKHFAAWVLTEGQKKAEELDYAPMPSSILSQAEAAVTA